MDNSTFPGNATEFCLQTFDPFIYGPTGNPSNKKKERNEWNERKDERKKDENVFDQIEQGVLQISIIVKRKGLLRKNVKHADSGERAEKYRQTCLIKKHKNIKLAYTKVQNDTTIIDLRTGCNQPTPL